jgi:hypothetical protein
MTKKIGWQKYESYIEDQITSPIMRNLMAKIAKIHKDNDTFLDDDEDEDEDLDDFDNTEDSDPPIMPITPQIVEEITMLSTFECWIAYTNFPITHKIKAILDEIPGVEALKICGRYRFFIGVGKMFDFEEVKAAIENTLIKGE